MWLQEGAWEGLAVTGSKQDFGAVPGPSTGCPQSREERRVRTTLCQEESQGRQTLVEIVLEE